MVGPFGPSKAAQWWTGVMKRSEKTDRDRWNNLSFLWGKKAADFYFNFLELEISSCWCSQAPLTMCACISVSTGAFTVCFMHHCINLTNLWRSQRETPTSALYRLLHLSSRSEEGENSPPANAAMLEERKQNQRLWSFYRLLFLCLPRGKVRSGRGGWWKLYHSKNDEVGPYRSRFA